MRSYILFFVLFAVFGASAQPTRDTTKRFPNSRYSRTNLPVGIYGGANTNQNLEFGINIPILNNGKQAETFLSKRGSAGKSGFGPVLSEIEEVSASYSGRMIFTSPFPQRFSIQIGIEKRWSSSVLRPSFSATITPFAYHGSMWKWPTGGKGAFFFRYWINHIIVQGTYLPEIRSYGQTIKIGAGIMLRYPSKMLKFHSYGVRLYLLYNRRFDSPNNFGFVPNEFSITLQLNKERSLTRYNLFNREIL